MERTPTTASPLAATVALDVPVVALEAAPQGSLAKRAWDNGLEWASSLFRRSPRT